MKIGVYNKINEYMYLCTGYSSAARIVGCHRDTIKNRLANKQSYEDADYIISFGEIVGMKARGRGF